MTFLEAAIEVLRHADGPLHFSEVARRAVDRNLLSHVGRDPEAAMRSCLNSAVRSGEDAVIVREKPGYYGIRPGAKLPDPPTRPAPNAAATAASKAENDKDSEVSESKSKVTSKASSTARGRARRGQDDEDEPEDATKRRSRRTRTARGEAPAPQVEVVAGRRADKAERAAEPAEPRPESPPQRPVPLVEFEAPSGSGLEGITDVALVMANAVSRLVEERPELRDELDAMQHRTEEASSSVGRPMAAPVEARREPMDDRASGSRRRRRRRRRGKRVDWSAGVDARGGAGSATDRLLDGVASVLEESGPRSLHVRQIAETLAGRGVLGGEISEIERAVTAAILLDIRTHGRASRFTARGDARYQLQGTRLPERAGRAEQSLRDAARTLEDETANQLVQWLHTLGARALESLVRIYLHREGYQLLSALPPSRGVGKLVVDDPEADDEGGRTLVLVVPRRTGLDPKLWEGELERNGCQAMLLFAMSDGVDEASFGDAARVIGAAELGAWLRQHGIGVDRMCIEVPVLDPTFIESVAGLDT